MQYLYEVNIKTKYKEDSLEINNYFESLASLFNDSTYASKKIQYKIHCTQIPTYEIAIDLAGWDVFKLTIALSKKLPLKEVVHKILMNVGKKDIKLLTNRIVVNKKKVEADVYFSELNAYLQENHPDHKVFLIYQDKTW
jgi:hypothetical protein